MPGGGIFDRPTGRSGTVQKRGVALGAAVARGDANNTRLPSGVQPWTVSAPGCHVSRVGSPPSVGTV